MREVIPTPRSTAKTVAVIQSKESRVRKIITVAIKESKMRGTTLTMYMQKISQIKQIRI